MALPCLLLMAATTVVALVTLATVTAEAKGGLNLVIRGGSLTGTVVVPSEQLQEAAALDHLSYPLLGMFAPSGQAPLAGANYVIEISMDFSSDDSSATQSNTFLRLSYAPPSGDRPPLARVEWFDPVHTAGWARGEVLRVSPSLERLLEARIGKTYQADAGKPPAAALLPAAILLVLVVPTAANLAWRRWTQSTQPHPRLGGGNGFEGANTTSPYQIRLI